MDEGRKGGAKGPNRWTRREVLAGLSALGLTNGLGLKGAEALGQSADLAASGSSAPDLLKYVNIFLGTGGHGHTYPGASVPFGMVQLSPDTYNDDWDWCSGYHSTDTSIMGFSHTHLSGTGCGDLLDFLLMPRVGEVKLVPGDRDKPGSGYRSRFSHSSEKAHPGYYSVMLDDTGILAELTATEHGGVHRYIFPESDSSHIVFDLTQAYGKLPGSVEWCSLEVAGKDMLADTLLAGHATNAWGPGREMYLALQASRPWDKLEIFVDGQPAPVGAPVRGQSVKAVLHYKTHANEAILLRAGLSGVNGEGARRNLAAEVPDWDFARVQSAAEAAWREQLGKIVVETTNDDDKKIFYSSLYHSMLGPTLFDDVDGRYRGMDGEVHQLRGGERNYTTFSLWDTYRAEHPLLTLIHADRVPDMVNSLVRMARESPAGMPVWPLQGKETGTMTGYHSAAVIAEACRKGFTGIDYKAAYECMHKRAFLDDYRGLKWYRQMGYIPCDLEEESVSKTLEYDYDDWAVAHVAHHLGETKDAQTLLERSRNYRNYWDASTGFLRPKFNNGSWATPFNPLEMGHWAKWRDYTESNAWQTTFGVQHDVTSYIELLGGDAAFVAKVDTLFNQPSTLPSDAPPDISGMVGQYAHGNEPSHHIAYLYSYAGQPHKTQERVHSLVKTMYSNSLDGIAGNEDVGQMSAWYILSSLGFYAVDPVSTHYVMGTPLFERAVLQLAGGRKLVIETRRESPASIYIDAVEFNGKRHARSWFAHEDVAGGGRFVFKLVDHPSADFGRSVADRPVSHLELQAKA